MDTALNWLAEKTGEVSKKSRRHLWLVLKCYRGNSWECGYKFLGITGKAELWYMITAADTHSAAALELKDDVMEFLKE